MRGLRLLGLLACLAACARPPEPPAPVPPAPAAEPSKPSLPAEPPAAAPPARGPACGLAACAAGEFCEDLFKGHRVDDRGRPLERKKCVPLPEECRAAPTCACVRKHVHATRCSDSGGLVTLDDYPR